MLRKWPFSGISSFFDHVRDCVFKNASRTLLPPGSAATLAIISGFRPSNPFVYSSAATCSEAQYTKTSAVLSVDHVTIEYAFPQKLSMAHGTSERQKIGSQGPLNTGNPGAA